jgi:hypothetical protein
MTHQYPLLRHLAPLVMVPQPGGTCGGMINCLPEHCICGLRLSAQSAVPVVADKGLRPRQKDMTYSTAPLRGSYRQGWCFLLLCYDPKIRWGYASGSVPTGTIWQTWLRVTPKPKGQASPGQLGWRQDGAVPVQPGD